MELLQMMNANEIRRENFPLEPSFKVWDRKTCGFCFFNEKQAELYFWSMHQEHVNPNMDQDGKPNKVTVTKTTSDKNHVEKVKNGHPDIKRSDTEVELPVDIH